MKGRKINIFFFPYYIFTKFFQHIYGCLQQRTKLNTAYMYYYRWYMFQIYLQVLQQYMSPLRKIGITDNQQTSMLKSPFQRFYWQSYKYLQEQFHTIFLRKGKVSVAILPGTGRMVMYIILNLTRGKVRIVTRKFIISFCDAKL